MPRFKTDSERMKHKQAKLIPASMWYDNQLFYENLDETVLAIMKVDKSENLIPVLTNSYPKLNDQWKKKQAWLGIALAHPNNFALLMQAAKILQFSNNSLFSLFVILGNLAFISEFTKELPYAEVLDLIKENEFYAYRKGAEHGHLGTLEFMETKAPDLTQEMIIANNYAAYKHAAQNGHVDIMKKLERSAPDLVTEMIQAQTYYPFRLAAHNGRLEVVKHLIAKANLFLDDMMQADNFFAYRKSTEKGHLDVSNELIANSSICFDYAEANSQKNQQNTANVSKMGVFNHKPEEVDHTQDGPNSNLAASHSSTVDK